ncbi:hypothetical protein [Bradyrhizobium sp. Cp5.3]|uniref:hypothetical protein n=1 Tax=Bradyrhizobium sp. Cp5.3 TaxID=443598 RepID=UPI000405B2D6|nr:hypothetical protein [Bradyrhizobium sp. Cp5.3]
MLKCAMSAAIILFLASHANADMISLSDMKNQIGRACPASLTRVSIIDANARCNPNMSVTKACDAKYEAPGKAWHACYEQVEECRRQVDEENQTVYDYNDWIAKCAAADQRQKDAAKPLQPGAAKDTGSGGDDFAARLDKAKARNQQMEATNGKQQEDFLKSLEQKRNDLIAAHQEEARIRAQLQQEREERRQAQLMRQLEAQQEQRAIAEAALGSFLQGFISAYSSSLPAPSGGGGGGSSGGCRGYVRGSCEASR